ncbi:hypothetical protein A2U01_0102660, partial [Trifolium medium]|nr:hypothetical protein [Trifolium medium]
MNPKVARSSERKRQTNTGIRKSLASARESDRHFASSL